METVGRVFRMFLVLLLLLVRGFWIVCIACLALGAGSLLLLVPLALFLFVEAKE